MHPNGIFIKRRLGWLSELPCICRTRDDLRDGLDYVRYAEAHRLRGGLAGGVAGRCAMRSCPWLLTPR